MWFLLEGIPSKRLQQSEQNQLVRGQVNMSGQVAKTILDARGLTGYWMRTTFFPVNDRRTL